MILSSSSAAGVRFLTGHFLGRGLRESGARGTKRIVFGPPWLFGCPGRRPPYGPRVIMPRRRPWAKATLLSCRRRSDGWIFGSEVSARDDRMYLYTNLRPTRWRFSCMTTQSNTTFSVRLAMPSDHPVLERLWALFRHDMSEFTGALPDRHGRFRQERLESAFSEPGWCAYLITLDDAVAGMAIARALDSTEHVLSSFFLCRAARRQGHGRAAALWVLRDNPGSWTIAFQDANKPAVAFWRAVASDAAGTEWSEENRPVPGRPELPSDTWISFRTEVALTP